MTKLGVLDILDMNVHAKEPLILNPEQKKIYDAFNTIADSNVQYCLQNHQMSNTFTSG